MPDCHTLDQQQRLLRQALSLNKNEVGIFLGAGCPVSIRVPRSEGSGDDPLIPDVPGMTAALTAGVHGTGHAAPLEAIRGQLQADGLPSPNLEDMLSHIRSLRLAAGTGEARGLKGATLKALDDELCNQIAALANRSLPNADTGYHALASWAGSIARPTPVQFFTTNYDLLLEEALEARRVPYFDGFVGSREAFFDAYAMEEDLLPARWCRVWKLHGSINWVEDKRGQAFRASPGPSTPGRMIHPSHLKYDESRRMPYLAMFDRLRAFFKQPAPVLVTCGFSFGDKHINENLDQGLRGNPSSVTFALLHGKLDTTQWR